MTLSLGAFGSLPVVKEPFPHILVDDWLERDVFEALAASFPTCPPASGPTGYTLFWGDPAYDRLIAERPEWGALFAAVHSQAFIDATIAQFRQVFDEEACVDLGGARYVAYCETREEKQRATLHHPDRADDELWVRLDVMQGREGYTREAHLDHRRRAISLLLYLSDADENGMEGGDLILHDAEGAPRKLVRPRRNRMVAFPCCNGSLHSVSPIVRQREARNFVQVTVSSFRDLWAPVATKPLWKRTLERLTRSAA